MEALSKKIRIFRSQENILSILDEYNKSDLSIKAFCIDKNIAQASFHNWKKKYSKSVARADKPAGFASLQITPVAATESVLFAEIKEIKIYQWVTAAYLKELLS